MLGNSRTWGLVTCAGAVAAIGVGCTSQPARNQPLPNGPIVYSIGNSSLITLPLAPKQANTSQFDSQQLTPPNPVAVYVPIRGRDLFNSGYAVRVAVQGTVPLVENSHYRLLTRRTCGNLANPKAGEFTDELLVELLPAYLQNLQTKDRLRIDYYAQESTSATTASGNTTGSRQPGPQTNSDGSDQPAPTIAAHTPPRIVQASRVFTVYHVQDYRHNVLANLVSLHDISAFPLPEKEVEFLFGEKIMRHFFVVRLSVRNTTGRDQLVTTSMIKASGTAMIETLHKDPVRFTVPVEVTPQSLSHVYTLLNDEEPNEPRAIVFRALEFAGALTTAVFTVVDASKTAVEALGVATGVGVPGLRKAWPDRYAGYKRNIVDYGMPDLVKIPSNGVSAHRYLFFSKSRLQNLILDQSLLGERKDEQRLTALAEGFEQPPVHVVHMAFDNLEIPYEQTTVESERDERRVLNSATEDMMSLERLKVDVTNLLGGDFTGQHQSAFERAKLADSDAKEPATKLLQKTQPEEIRKIMRAIVIGTDFDVREAQRRLDDLRTSTIAGSLTQREQTQLGELAETLRADVRLISTLKEAIELAKTVADDVSKVNTTTEPANDQEAVLGSLRKHSSRSDSVLVNLEKAQAREPGAATDGNAGSTSSLSQGSATNSNVSAEPVDDKSPILPTVSQSREAAIADANTLFGKWKSKSEELLRDMEKHFKEDENDVLAVMRKVVNETEYNKRETEIERGRRLSVIAVELLQLSAWRRAITTDSEAFGNLVRTWSSGEGTVLNEEQLKSSYPFVYQSGSAEAREVFEGILKPIHEAIEMPGGGKPLLGAQAWREAAKDGAKWMTNTQKFKEAMLKVSDEDKVRMCVMVLAQRLSPAQVGGINSPRTVHGPAQTGEPKDTQEGGRKAPDNSTTGD